MKITSIILAGALPMIMLPLSVEGHGYMYSPRSRNFYAHLDGVDGDAVAGIPPKEYCHHCLNTNNGVCGKSAYHDYDVWNDSLDNPMPWISQATFTAGDTIRVKSHLTAYHYGHMELRGCPLGRDSTWDCFEKPEHTLRFVRDISFDMPADPAYPERGYYYGSTDFEMEYEIPETLYGATVLLQVCIFFQHLINIKAASHSPCLSNTSLVALYHCQQLLASWIRCILCRSQLPGYRSSGFLLVSITERMPASLPGRRIT